MNQIECWQCKHWYKPTSGPYGTCGRIVEGNVAGEAAYLTACSCVEPDLMTKAEFSCNLAESL